MENIGPIVLFLLYMVISAWAKRNKNQRLQEGKEKYTEQEGELPPVQSKVEGFFEQLKRELLEDQEEVLPLPFMNPMSQEVELPETPEYIPDDYEPPEELAFVEGSPSIVENLHDHHLAHLDDIEASSSDSKKSLDEVLKPYSTIQKGIILHEILGKPRALRDNKEWYHSY